MGSDDFYPEERPVHPVAVDGFWMDEHPGDRRRVPALRQATRATSPWPSDRSIPRTIPAPTPSCSCRARSCSTKPPGRSTSTTSATGGRTCPARTGSARGPGSNDRRAAIEHPGHAGRLRGRRGVRGLGGQGAADRGRVGVRGPRRARGRRRSPGADEFAPRGDMMANTWQGEFPWQNLRLDGYEGTSPVGTFPPNGYGLYRHGRATSGSGPATSSRRSHPDDGARALLRPAQPAGRLTATASFDVGPAGRTHPAPGDQGRLASVRAELLPALPARGTPGRRRSTRPPATSASAAFFRVVDR